MASEMRDGIRWVLNKRASKRAGKNIYSYKVPYRDANGKQTSETFTEYRRAEKFRNKIRTQRDEGLVIDVKAGRTSVRDYAHDTYLQAAKAKRETTYKLLETHVRRHIVPVLGGRQLRAVTRSDVQTLVNALTAKGLAPRTVLVIYKTLVAIFNSARLDKKITESPCVKIELPEIPEEPMAILTVRQVRALAAAMPEPYQVAVIIAAGTGLRASEVTALTWDRIDLDARILTVDRQIDPKGRFAPPKTKRSRRTVPIPDLVAEALLAHRAAFPPVGQDVEHVSGTTVKNAALVITRPTGKPVTGNVLTKGFAKARAAVDLAVVPTFHGLRHFYASVQIAAGTSLTALQDRMGHHSIKITSDIYGHLLPEEDDRTCSAIDAAFTNDQDGNDGTAGLPLAA